MGGVSEYYALDSRYNEFLFAEIGEQDNGMPMSMASALTRLGLDPWDEACRLAALPSSSAVSAVSHMIARTAGLDAPISDIPKLSAKLVDLLASGRSRSPVRKLALGKIALGGRSWKLDGRWLAAVFAVGLVIIVSRLILMG